MSHADAARDKSLPQLAALSLAGLLWLLAYRHLGDFADSVIA